MSAPRIHGVKKTLSANSLLMELGNALARIRMEDGLTWADMGRVLGKSEDTAAHYADASAEMGVTAYYFARREWNGRFTDGADKLLSDSRGSQDPQRSQTLILHAALTLSAALEDGELTVEEIRANRSTLENARDAIDAQLSRLKPEAVNG